MSQDEELRKRFAELARAEGASAPSFRQVLERERSGLASSRLFSLKLGAAVLVAAGALAALLLLRPAPPEKELSPAATIGQWKSPTGWLLQTPGQELLEELPALPDSTLAVGLPEVVEKTERKTPTAPRGRRR